MNENGNNDQIDFHRLCESLQLTKNEIDSMTSNWNYCAEDPTCKNKLQRIKATFEMSVQVEDSSKNLSFKKWLDKLSSDSVRKVNNVNDLIKLYENDIYAYFRLIHDHPPVPPAFINTDVSKQQSEEKSDEQHGASTSSLFYCSVFITFLGGGASALVGSANQQWKFNMGVKSLDELLVTIGFSIVSITVLCFIGHFMYTHRFYCSHDEQGALRV